MFIMIWHVVVWIIWLMLNNKLLPGIQKNVKKVTERSHFLYWNWFLCRSNVNSIFLSDFLENPILLNLLIAAREVGPYLEGWCGVVVAGVSCSVLNGTGDLNSNLVLNWREYWFLILVFEFASYCSSFVLFSSFFVVGFCLWYLCQFFVYVFWDFPLIIYILLFFLLK